METLWRGDMSVVYYRGRGTANVIRYRQKGIGRQTHLSWISRDHVGVERSARDTTGLICVSLARMGWPGAGPLFHEEARALFCLEVYLAQVFANNAD